MNSTYTPGEQGSWPQQHDGQDARGQSASQPPHSYPSNTRSSATNPTVPMRRELWPTQRSASHSGTPAGSQPRSYGRPPQSPTAASPYSGGRASTSPIAETQPYGVPVHPSAQQPSFAATLGAGAAQMRPAHLAPPVTTWRKRSRSVPWLMLLLPVMLVVGAVGGYLLATNYNSFDSNAMEHAVAQVLREDYGLSDLDSVDCPNWIKVEQGESFQCEFEYAGGTQTVTVTQGSQSGQVVVGAPE